MNEPNPILEVAVSDFLRPEIALTLQHVMNIYTVANLIDAWNLPREQRRIEQLFDSAEQARHAISVCATWLGFETFTMNPPPTNPWRAGAAGIKLTVPARFEIDA